MVFALVIMFVDVIGVQVGMASLATSTKDGIPNISIASRKAQPALCNGTLPQMKPGHDALLARPAGYRPAQNSVRRCHPWIW